MVTQSSPGGGFPRATHLHNLVEQPLNPLQYQPQKVLPLSQHLQFQALDQLPQLHTQVQKLQSQLLQAVVPIQVNVSLNTAIVEPLTHTVDKDANLDLVKMLQFQHLNQPLSLLDQLPSPLLLTLVLPALLLFLLLKLPQLEIQEPVDLG